MNINKVVLVGTIISDVVETQFEKDKMVRLKYAQGKIKQFDWRKNTGVASRIPFGIYLCIEM